MLPRRARSPTSPSPRPGPRPTAAPPPAPAPQRRAPPPHFRSSSLATVLLRLDVIPIAQRPNQLDSILDVHLLEDVVQVILYGLS